MFLVAHKVAYKSVMKKDKKYFQAKNKLRFISNISRINVKFFLVESKIGLSYYYLTRYN